MPLVLRLAPAVFSVACGAAPETRGAPHAPPVGAPGPPPTVAAPPPPAAPEGDPSAPPPPERWWKVQLHAHTDRSHDGTTPPEEVARFYQEKGYDVLALTDHNRVTQVRWPGPLQVVAGVELTQNTERCHPPPPAGFRCLLHTSVTFLDPSRDAHAGGRFTPPYAEDRTAAFRSHLALARHLGGVPILNHPFFHAAADARLIAALAAEGLRLVEFINASLDSQHPRGVAAARRRAEALWDQLLDRGVLVYAVATDDAHHFGAAVDRRRRHGRFPYEGDRAWVEILARDREGLRASLEGGRFVATTGVRPRRVGVERGELVVEVEAGTATTVRFVGPGGRVLAVQPGPLARFPLGPGWLRAVVERADGAVLFTQPVRAEG